MARVPQRLIVVSKKSQKPALPRRSELLIAGKLAVPTRCAYRSLSSEAFVVRSQEPSFACLDGFVNVLGTVVGTSTLSSAGPRKASEIWLPVPRPHKASLRALPQCREHLRMPVELFEQECQQSGDECDAFAAGIGSGREFIPGPLLTRASRAPRNYVVSRAL